MDNHGSESPPSRTTILSSFLRGRPRNSSTSQPHVPTLNVSTDHHHLPNPQRELSPIPTPVSPRNLNRRSVVLPVPVTSSTSNNPTAASPYPPSSVPNSTPAGLGFTSMLRRRRSAGTVAASASTSVSAAPAPQAAPSEALIATYRGQTHRIRIVPHIDSRRSLRFDPITRDISYIDPPLRIGRFTDRSGLGISSALMASSNKIAFRSKVVSRSHAEISVSADGKFYIKDTKSSSGTFLNHVRLAPANTESKNTQIKDGDVIQFGVDYQGGAEEIYKSVKVRIEIGREWQAGVNKFNSNAIKQLRAISALAAAPGDSIAPGGEKKKKQKSNIPDCCICLFSITIQQALFVAPCSHAFHFKCIRPLLEQHYPAFNCPLCRTYADLNVDVEVDQDFESSDEEAESENNKGGETDVEGLQVAPRASPSVEEVEEVLVEGEEEEEMVHVPMPMPIPRVDEEEDVLMFDSDEGVGMSMSPLVPVPVPVPSGAGVGMVSEMGEAVLLDADATVGEKRKR